MRTRPASTFFLSLFVAGTAMWALPTPSLRAQPAATTAATERPHILVFLPPTGAATLPRLRAELAVAGFDLRFPVGAGWPPSRDEMEQLARRLGAVAAVAFIPNEAGSTMEIWVVDRVTGKSVVRVFSSPRPGHGDEADLLAVSAVETLRATMMEINLAQPARGEVAPPPAVRALVGEEVHRFAGRLGPAIGYGRDGVGGAWQLAMAFTVAVRPRLRLGLDAVLPLSTADVSGPEGKANVQLWLAGPLVELALGDPAARGGIGLAAGAWATVLRMRGSAAPPYAGVDSSVITVAPHLDLVGRWRLGRRLGLAAICSVAVAAPEAVVQFSSRDAARWGRPFGLGSLVVEASLD